MAKRVRVTVDAGSTYRTLPGNQGELSNEAGDLDDTIFGQNFRSTQPGIINWQINANGIYKGFAGYTAEIYQQSGSATTMTGEACSQIGATKSYQITDTAKRIMDIDTTTVVLDSASPVAAEDIESIDFLFGIVTFDSSYTVSGAVTITGAYFAKTQVAGTRSFTLTMQSEPIDNTTIPIAQANSGHRTHGYGLKTVSLELGGVYALANGFQAALVARSRLIVEINPVGDDKTLARGYFRYTREGQSGNVGALEEETITLALAVPDENDALLSPFYWRFTSDTTLNQAMQDLIGAWQDEALIGVQYLFDGTNGLEAAEAMVSDISLTGGLEAMNVFAATFMCNDAAAAVP